MKKGATFWNGAPDRFLSRQELQQSAQELAQALIKKRKSIYSIALAI